MAQRADAHGQHQRMTTLVEVVRLAGVTAAAVSNVLRDDRGSTHGRSRRPRSADDDEHRPA